MSEEVLVHEGRIAVPYAWSAGEVLSRFLKALRDERKILANRCPGCRKVYVPPKKTCGTCFADCGDWLEVGPRGRLISFTQALYDDKRPIYGRILLDGADTGLLHFLSGAELGELRSGMAVEAVFAESRAGSILDISHFAPIGDG